MIERKHMEWVATAVMVVVVAVVFQQVYTDMMEAGIARGGPYENAASYPRSLAIILGVLVIIEVAGRFITPGSRAHEQASVGIETKYLGRPALLLVVFSLYLGLLRFLGYHLTTTPFLLSVMIIAGERRWGRIIITSLVFSFALAFVFEVLLKIVLPGGIFRFNIPW